jgi:predicted ATPase/DNA-binding winged helix-turn-helix (wHTH) protein
VTLVSQEAVTAKTVCFGPYELIGSERLLLRNGNPVAVGGRALDILIALIDRAHEVVSWHVLIDLVWPDVIVSEASLRVHLTTLRRALGDGLNGARYIVNIPGRGYSFVAPLVNVVANGAATSAGAEIPTRLKIPPVSHTMLGRSTTVELLASLLLAHRFVTVAGPGGIGKTTVAVAVAHAVREEFADDAICFVDLGALSDSRDIVTVIATALGSVPQASEPETHIRAFLAGRPFLILIDNCEHVIDAIATICERLFLALPMVHLLATSREALRVEGEIVHLLPPLSCPDEEFPSAATALASPAVQLFMERAASGGHRAELSDQEAPVVANICRHLDGVALAIELAAARVGNLGIAGAAELLNSGGTLALQGRRSALPRHQTLNGLLDWSYRLLSNDEQYILCRLSVFVGPFGLNAIQALTAAPRFSRQAVANAIASLADKSLVTIATTPGDGFYRLLDTTRAYGAELLAKSGEGDSVARCHAVYFTDLLRAAAAERSLADGRRVDAFAPQVGNVRKALSWSFSASGDLAVGIDLAIHAAPLFVGLSLFVECQEWCQKSLDRLSETGADRFRELKLQEALAMSSMYTWYSSRDVRSAIERGLQLAEALHEPRHRFRLLGHLSVYYTRRGDFAKALAAAQMSAVFAKSAGGASERAISQWMLAASHHLAGDQAAALHHCEKGFALAADAAPAEFDLFYETRACYAHARSLWLCGLPDRAETVAHQTIAAAARHGHHFSYGVALLYTIPVFLWSGKLDGVAERIEVAIARAEKFSLAPFHALGLALKGEFLVECGDAAAGVEVLQRALRTMQLEKFHIATPGAARALADGLCRIGRPDEGWRLLRTLSHRPALSARPSCSLTC